MKLYYRFRYLFEVLFRILGYKSGRRTCTFCNFIGRFQSIGHPPRYEAKCPNCGSLERHRLLALVNQDEEFFLDKDILHFAPERIISSLIKQSAKQYLTADISPEKADCVLNIEQIELPNESWDVIVCSHVLEHVDDRLALLELYRILRPKGQLIVMVPIIEGWEVSYENDSITTEQDRELHFGQNDHVRYYGRDIRYRLINSGFTVKEYTAFGEDVVTYGLLRGEKVFICTKHN